MFIFLKKPAKFFKLFSHILLKHRSFKDITFKNVEIKKILNKLMIILSTNKRLFNIKRMNFNTRSLPRKDNMLENGNSTFYFICITKMDIKRVCK